MITPGRLRSIKPVDNQSFDARGIKSHTVHIAIVADICWRSRVDGRKPEKNSARGNIVIGYRSRCGSEPGFAIFQDPCYAIECKIQPVATKVRVRIGIPRNCDSVRAVVLN